MLSSGMPVKYVDIKQNVNAQFAASYPLLVADIQNYAYNWLYYHSRAGKELNTCIQNNYRYYYIDTN